MRLLVISDTHGYLDAARRVIAQRGPWDQVVHLGDSLLDAVALAAELPMNVIAVRGNNEYAGAGEAAEELVFLAEGVGFFALHGHDLDVNVYDGAAKWEAALAEIARRAAAAGARVALFGHTHQPLIREVGGVLLVNPGGLGLGDQRKTYAVITVAAGEVRAEIAEVTGEV